MWFTFEVLSAFFFSCCLIILNSKKALNWNSDLCLLKRSHCTEDSVLIALGEDGAYVHTVQSDHCPERHDSFIRSDRLNWGSSKRHTTPGNLLETIKQSEIKQYLHLVSSLYHNTRTAGINWTESSF